ncbi:hypothetical protein [Streptomyces orinoci]|uniref:Uncharacterized protein n=1 Tax=Streptomyces orinoci TaxID=67339 RepID=A0ABV3JVM1_STRON|nr:hypothetical protein [Streptomyces orinoci]
MTHYAVFLAVTGLPTGPVSGLTALTVPAHRLAEAEARASAALAGLPEGAGWADLEPDRRRELVARVRTVPHHAADHIEHNDPAAPGSSALADCLAGLAANSSLKELAGQRRTVYFTGDRPLGDAAGAPFLAGASAVHRGAENRYPALARLAALLGTAAGPSTDGSLPEDQDLYEAFDRYTVGGP